MHPISGSAALLGCGRSHEPAALTSVNTQRDMCDRDLFFKTLRACCVLTVRASSNAWLSGTRIAILLSAFNRLENPVRP